MAKFLLTAKTCDFVPPCTTTNAEFYKEIFMKKTQNFFRVLTVYLILCALNLAFVACSNSGGGGGGGASPATPTADVSEAITADTLGLSSESVMVSATSKNTAVAKITDEVYDSADIVSLDANTAVSYLKSFKITAVGAGKTYIDVKTKVISSGDESHKYIPVTVKSGKLSEKTAAAIKSVVTDTEPGTSTPATPTPTPTPATPTAESYSITIESITNGTVTASKTSAVSGEEITLTVNPADGYALDSLTVKDADGSDVTVTANKFTMPAKNVTVSATFKVATVTYSVTIDGAITGGTVVADKTTGIASGSTVTLTITPATGKVLDALTVKDSANNAVSTTTVEAGMKYSFAMPENNVSVTATFKNVYTVTVGSLTGGTVEADKTTGISSGETVTLTVTAGSEKLLDAITVKDASNNTVTTSKVTAGKKYTFTMPESNATVTATFVNPYSWGYAGDIVLSDGKFITVTNYETYSEQLTQTAIAVIFDTSSSGKKGVGLKQGTGLQWAFGDTIGCTTNISTLAATKTGSFYVSGATFSGDGAEDGSGSLDKFRTAVGATAGTALSSTDYPAWAFVEGYATTAGLTGTYASGWYMPSIGELCKLYRKITDVNNALSKITGAAPIITSGDENNYASYYWSSSQEDDAREGVWVLIFGAGQVTGSNKACIDYSVRVIRAF